MYIMAYELVSIAYFINPSYQSMCLHVNPPIVARQRFGKIFSAAKNVQATIEELLDASLSVRSVTNQRKLGA
jgi:hypothetical protein